MVYSNTSTKAGIIQMIEETTGQGDGAITGSTQKFAYINNLVNNWYRIAAYIAWKADKVWSFDDSNHTTFPQVTTTIVDNQRDYTLPTTALRLRDVEVMNASGDYYTLRYMREDDARLLSEKEQEEAGIPSDYRLVGNVIILYPKPDASLVTTAAGIRITIDREVDPFTVSDTTQEPGLPAQFHPILYYGPSFEYATVNGLKDVSSMCLKMLGDFPGLTSMLGTFFAERNQDVVRSLKRNPIKYR
jgi:hypothetical protein